MAGRPSPYPERNPCLPYCCWGPNTYGSNAKSSSFPKKSILTINTEASLFNGCLIEFLCVFIYVIIPHVANAAFLLAITKIFGDTTSSFNYLITFFSYAIYLGALRLAYNYSAHMSPAVTLLEVFPKKKIVPYICSQLLAAFAATLCIYGFLDPHYRNFNIALSIDHLFPTWAVVIGESLVGLTVGSLIVIAMTTEENFYLQAKHTFWVILPNFVIIGLLSHKYTMLDISVLDPIRGLGGQVALSILSGSVLAGQGWFILFTAIAASTIGIMVGASYYSDLLPEDPAILEAELEKKVQAWTRFR